MKGHGPNGKVAANREFAQGRSCRACGSELSRYNPGPFCYLHRELLEDDPPKVPVRGHVSRKLCLAVTPGMEVCKRDPNHDGEHEWV